jgi:hypothetical protein
MDSESQQGIPFELQVILHPRCSQQPVNLRRWAGMVLAKHFQQFNGYVRLALEKRAAKGIHFILSIAQLPESPVPEISKLMWVELRLRCRRLRCEPDAPADC